MAYPTVSKPYGLIPINLIGGQVYAGATRKRRIASGYGTSIFYGDLVKLTTDGTIVLADETATGPSTGFAGVFLGCNFINPSTKQLQFQQYYQANTTVPAGTIIEAIICDDPDALFKVAVVSGTTVVTGVQYSAIGENADLVQNPGVAATGNSQVAINATTGTARTKPIRIVDVVPDTSYVDTGTGNILFPEVIVKINAPSVDGDGTGTSSTAHGLPR